MAIVLRGVPPRTWLGFMPPDGVKGFLVLHGFSSCAQWCSFVSRVVQDVQGVSTLSHVKHLGGPLPASNPVG